VNATLPAKLRDALADASLDDKYTIEKGRVRQSGPPALVRLPMLQKARERAASSPWWIGSRRP